MVKISRVLRKFSDKEKDIISLIIHRLVGFDFKGLDIKKISGQPDIFRVRKGKLRIIYNIKGGEVIILSISKRAENTYKNL